MRKRQIEFSSSFVDSASRVIDRERRYREL
jgi:hypothetical protein